MPLMPMSRHGRPLDALNRLRAYIYFTLNGGVVASLVVAVLSFALWALRINLEYVAGAFLIYGAQRIAQKRISPTTLRVPDPPKQAVRRQLDGEPSPKGPTS